MTDNKSRLSNKSKFVEHLDDSIIHGILDRWSIYGYIVQEHEEVQQTVLRLCSIIVAEDLGVVLDPQEMEFIQNFSPRVLDTVNEAIGNQTPEMIENIIFVEVDHWMETEHGVFPDTYTEAKDGYLKELSPSGLDKKPPQKRYWG